MSQLSTNNRAALQFKPPGSYGSAYRTVAEIPPGHKRVLRFAFPLHTTWGADDKNFVLQQTSIIKNPEIGLVEIHVIENSLLGVECVQDATFLVYTLEGYHFLYMEGYGPVPVFSLTYTLQPIPQGNHRLLVTRGTCALLYIAADELLTRLQNGGESLVPLNKYVVSAPKSGVLRLPIDTNVDLLLHQLINLPEHPDPFSLPYITTHLLLLLPQQLQASSINDHDISGSMMVFIAENIQMPVPWLLAQLQEKFSMNRRRAKAFLRNINL